MAGWTRVLGQLRARTFGALAGLSCIATACGSPPSGTPVQSGPELAGIGGGDTVSVGPSVGGSAVGEAGSGVTCTLPDVDQPVFGAQIFDDLTAARVELYSWTTDLQAMALRSNPDLLFTQNQQPAFSIASLGSLLVSSDPAVAQLAALVNGALMNGRFAWPEPWALRIGPDGKDAGDNLLRIVLKPEAWLAVLKGADIEVLDMNNKRILPADAAAAPERFGAVFYERDSLDGGPLCDGAIGGAENGFREFVVGNPGMVAEWSLATQQIKDHLSSNIAQLTEFLNRTRSCPDQTSQQSWNRQIVCGWPQPVTLPISEQLAYAQALAIPSTDYFDAPPQLGAMIDRLQGDLFEPDPLVVTPGSP